ncbi:hypothetical protein EVG20_g3458 [Dentipellis fragilis]|uniref:Uncharacterized protein n=1 Tax=Dentipellis fragilis TaxID=205917 RepID=A0A4Y9Z231_9AGAM|nr:hypothetical protein EVG20_g3458 [Dentipellis fragilis]
MNPNSSKHPQAADSDKKCTKADLRSVRPRPAWSPQLHGVLVNAVAFSSNGLASASEDTGVRLWRIGPGSEHCDPIPPSFLHESSVSDVAFTSDGEYLASGSDNGTVLLWHHPLADSNPGQRVSSLLRDAGHISSLRFSPDGSRLAVTTQSWTNYVVDIRSEPVVHELKGNSLPALLWQCKPAFTPHGTFLISACIGGKVTIWHTDQLTNTVAKCHSEAIYAIDVSPDGSRFVSGSMDGTLYLGYIDTKGCAKSASNGTIAGHRSAVYAVEFAKQGDFFASASQDCTVRLWQNKTGQPIAVYTYHTDIVSSISISFDGAIIASGSHDGSVRFWDTTTHDAIGEPMQGRMRSIVFSPDGSLLASISHGQNLRVWCLYTGNLDTD